MDSTFPFITKYFAAGNLAATLIEFGLKILSAAVVLAVGMILIRIIISILRSTVKRTVRDSTVRSYIQSA